jgi:acetyl-CoA acetyltransferase
MSDYTPANMPPPLPEFSRKAAIVGIGESDYHNDYKAERQKAEGWKPREIEELVQIAFDRALADAGLDKSQIDGIATSYTYGGPSPDELAAQFGISPRYRKENGNIMAGPLPVVCADIAKGEADTVAMIFSVCSRAAGRQFGGANFAGSGGYGAPDSYYYYLPWGFSSQAAHWALMYSWYAATHGATEEDLGHVALQVREHAAMNPNAIMQKRLTMEDYFAARYIVRPLRLFDICLVNDGAVCLIVRKAELAKAMAKPPVLVSGWGESKVKHSKMDAMVRERLRLQMEDARGQALAMAGLSLDTVGHFECYDASSMHLINQVEGFGFVPPGDGFAFCRDGQMTLGGRLPTNMGGGNLSGSYMQGWSQVAEVVRQLRGESGARQVDGLTVSMSSLVQTDQAHPIVYERGE